MFFSGKPQQRKVDLRGKSRGEETREQILERTRAERERRQQSKLESKSASLIQSHWRQLAAARKFDSEQRQHWAHVSGNDGSRQALLELFTRDPKLLSALLFCYDYQQEVDRRALASVCSACASSAAAGFNSLLAAAAGAAVHASRISNGGAQHRTAADPTHEQLALFRLQKLSLLCLNTLAAGGPEAAAVLCSSYASLAALQQQHPMAAMLDFLVKVVNPDTWRASILGSTQQQQQQQADTAAAAGAEAVLRHLFVKGLTAKLRMLLLVLPLNPGSRTCAEGCVTQMVVRVLKLHLLPAKGMTQTHGASLAAAGVPSEPSASPISPSTAAAALPPAPAAAVDAMQLGATQLLCVPTVWSRAPSLVPVAPRLCGLVLGELQQLQGGKQLADALLQCGVGQPGQQKVPGSSRTPQVLAPAAPAPAAAAAGVDAAAVAVAGLAESFIEAAAAGTVFKGLSQQEQVVTAGKLVSSLVMLLDAARQLSALQQRQWRMKQHKQSRKQQAGGRSIYDTRSCAGPSKKAGYVPGAGFVAQKGAPAAATAADMNVDAGRQPPESPSMAAHAGAGEAARAAAAAVTAEVASDTAAMDVDGTAATTAAAPLPPGHDSASGMAAADVGAGSAAAAAAGGAGGSSSAADAAKASKAAAAADAAAIEQPVAASAWSAEDHNNSSKPSQVTAIDACLQLLAGTSKGLQLLKLLVATLLPATTAAQARELYHHQQQQPQPAAAASLPSGGTAAAGAGAAAAAGILSPGCAAQQQLLELIWGLSRVPEHRQRVWLGLGVGARLVPRLWCSLVLPIHLSTPGGLLYFTGSTGSSSSRGSSSGAPGPDKGQQQQHQGGVAGSWMLPLLVLCQAFNAALSFTQIEDFYAADGGSCVLPLSQLYDAGAPAAGLIMLAKAAVWQVLWFNSVCPPGLPPPPPALQQQQQQLKTAVAEVCGLLLCQLHDRNCQRQFCPPAAFLCELATAAPARLQQEVAAAAARMGAAGDGSEEDGEGVEDSAWQQQQQWQQQRQQGLGPLAAVAAAAAADSGDAFGSRDSSGAGGALDPAAAGEDPATAAAGGGRSPGSRVWVVLEHAPCLVPFELRVQLLQHVLELEKAAAVESGEVMRMWDDPMESFENRFVTIRRDELMEDGFSQIGRMDPDRVKGRLRIQYVNEAGLPEAGIDGGGLFKDFMEELLRQGFSPQTHLMAENPQHQLYPNPTAFAKYTDAEHRMGFLGRMLGKCLYEGMLLELPLAAFFLKKMRGGVCDINDMPSLDPEVYKHLLQLRHYKGDYAELSLTFTATVVESAPSSTGTRQREIELKPGGRDITVKPDNVIEYIHRLADFRLNRQMDRAAAAFLRGFFELIKPRWVRMFNEAELQMLISGSEEGVDVDDLMKHINYAGGYHEEHPVIITLWETLRGFTPQEQRQFLKFVTSCSRAPLLGFAYLEPRVCVQMSGGMLQPGATQRLPTAATCMNLLKLPPYRTVKEMREKLLYAISAGAGFELS